MHFWRVFCIGLLLSACMPIHAVMADDAGDGGSRPKLHTISPFQVYTLDAVVPSAWERLSDDDQQQNVAGLKTFAREAIRKGKLSLTLTESPHFLIYSTVSSDQVREDLLGLENAYAQLGRFLDVNKPFVPKGKVQGPNLWRGKMLFFIFDDSSGADANKFIPIVHPGENQQIPAITLNGNGSVDVVTIQGNSGSSIQRDQAKEMVIAFLFRWHSPAMPPDWLLSAFSQSFGDSLMYPAVALPTGPRPAIATPPTAAQLRTDLAKTQDLEQMLQDPTQNQVPKLEEELLLFMTNRNAHRLAEFVRGVKDGMPWEKSLEEKYGKSLKALCQDYQDWVAHLRG